MDTIQITQYLQKRFDIGHSWGSMVAILVVKQHPEYYYSYIGVSQVVNYEDALVVGYEMMLNEAEEDNKNDVLKILKKVGKPPYLRSNFTLYRKCIQKISGFIKTKSEEGITKAIFMSKEYSFQQKNCISIMQ